MNHTKLPKLQAQPSVSPSERRNYSFIQRFYNLPISSKQLIALIACELFSIVGLGVGATWIITTGLRNQLLNQAKSEVAVTEINYNIKINQMGFGFRGQSDNTTIINAARVYETSRSLTPQLQVQVKQILQNEIKARQIEYATLVGKDLRIIVNANANREGEIFNPNNLVSEVLTNPQQLKASAIVSRAELLKESPPSSPGFVNQDALIRYTVTPIREPSTKRVIAALVSGDIVNGKLPIVTGTLKAFGGGYSAVYLRKPTGEFALATAVDQGKAASLNQAKLNVGLSNTSLLTAAAVNKGQLVTGRMVVGSQTYTMAAKTIPNKIVEEASGPVPVFSDQPVAILVRGTPEIALNNLLHKSLLQEIVVFLLALLVIGIWAILLRRAIIKPIEQLDRATHSFAEGHRSSRAEVFSSDEVGKLAVTFNKMADNIVASERILAEQALYQEAEAERTQLFTDVTLHLRQSLNLKDIIETAVEEIQKALVANRVIIYRIDSNWSGSIVAQSIDPNWSKFLPESKYNPDFDKNDINLYQNGYVRVIDDIYQAGLTEDNIKLLERFEVKASLTASILVENQLFGLIIAHQCHSPRAWQQSEVDLFIQLATQIGIALEQANLLEQIKVVSQDQRQQKEALQRQLVELLADIEGASSGDLTVRAEVTAGEIGTVADFFNAIVESLRQIVTSVKKAATQVNISVGENEGAMRQLAREALKQAEEITRTLDSVERMTLSIQEVAHSAQIAAEVARTASTTAEAGEVAMDRTVQSILNLRQTVSETANKVKRLGESSRQISKVVSLINQIALQTNLLAINASIEATRAGEEGQSFAIVAEKVGQLAAQSAAATKEIEPIVENIQRETNFVLTAIELSMCQVIEGTHLVEDTKKSLGQMIDVSRKIDLLVQSISSATVSQAQTSQAVTNLMKEIAKISDSTSDSSSQVSSSLRKTVEVAQQLQASVGAFKVDAD